eukprot:CAMPEP_0172711240 /NCGR_PEP_ID=MMETSP1074-20121228/58427_1 /TAXON_ID=2916 /ORGANISM="Ceratium fusus, Strain PA161109" /LENGTH=57 /DNA_ID=CAMNT_0013534851 /DNA_START=74 /DNA_END=247 /DNA_ORIENTATION=-
MTSSSLRIGTDRTEYLARRSLLSIELIMMRRLCDGAVKYALRALRREELTEAFCFIL